MIWLVNAVSFVCAYIMGDMFTTPPFTPIGGFTEGLANKDLGARLRAPWLTYVAAQFPNALDAIGGGYYQLAGADLRMSSDTRAFVLNFPDPSHKIELRGHTVLGPTNDANLATGQGSVTIEIDCKLSGDNARFRERNRKNAAASDAALDFTADTWRAPNGLAADVTYTLPPRAEAQGGECVRIVNRGGSPGKTIHVTGDGVQGELCSIDGGTYCVVEFRFDALNPLVGDDLGCWFVASPVQTGMTLVSPYPIA